MLADAALLDLDRYATGRGRRYSRVGTALMLAAPNEQRLADAIDAVAASSKTRPVTAGARAIPSIKSGFFCAPHTRRLTPRQKERLREVFTADEAHISVDVAYLHWASARGLPPSHTHPRPTPGRTPHPAPTSLSHPRNRLPGPDPTQVEGRILGLLRYRRSQQRLHGSHQWTLSSWADESPEATATPPATNSECSSSQEA